MHNAVEPVSNCLDFQVVIGLVLRALLRTIRSLRIVAVRASLAGLPPPRSR